MSDFGMTWELTRKRFEDEVAGLTKEQLNWRLYPGANSIGQMAIHVAGVEVSFSSQLRSADLGPFLARVRRAATDGTVNDSLFPFCDDEIEPVMVQKALECARAMVEPLINEPTPEIRAKEIVSALGPVITGEGAFARLGYHAGYHQGQVYQIKSAPGFPRG